LIKEIIHLILITNEDHWVIFLSNLELLHLSDIWSQVLKFFNYLMESLMTFMLTLVLVQGKNSKVFILVQIWASMLVWLLAYLMVSKQVCLMVSKQVCLLADRMPRLMAFLQTYWLIFIQYSINHL